MTDGWIPAFRKLFKPDHPIGMGAPACPRFAWLDICQGAPREDFERSLGRSGGRFIQRRGTVLLAQRTLAKRWGWTRWRVRQFIDFLIDEEGCLEVIGPPPGVDPNRSDGTLYRVVNYEAYALFQGDDEGVPMGPFDGPDDESAPPALQPQNVAGRSALRNQRATDQRAAQENTGDPEGGGHQETDGAPPPDAALSMWITSAQEQDIQSIIQSTRGFSTASRKRQATAVGRYLGEHAAATFRRMAEAFEPGDLGKWIRVLEMNYIPGGVDVRVFRGVAPEARPELLARAVGEFAIQHPEGERFNAAHFRGFLLRAVSQELRPVTADGLSAAEEEAKLQAARANAQERANAKRVPSREGLPLGGRTEEELREWFAQQPEDAQMEIRRTRDRMVSILAQGGAADPRARASAELEAIWGAYRQSDAMKTTGPQTVGQVLGGAL